MWIFFIHVFLHNKYGFQSKVLCIYIKTDYDCYLHEKLMF